MISKIRKHPFICSNVYDIKGEYKKRVKTNDLLALFDEIRKKEQADPTTAEMLMNNYI